MLLVQHALCEHGELVHAHEEAAGGAIGEDAGASGERASSAHPERGSAGALTGHDHCTASVIHHAAAEIGESLAEPVLLSIDLSGLLTESFGARPIAMLALAPKGSPPRA